MQKSPTEHHFGRITQTVLKLRRLENTDKKLANKSYSYMGAIFGIVDRYEIYSVPMILDAIRRSLSNFKMLQNISQTIRISST